VKSPLTVAGKEKEPASDEKSSEGRRIEEEEDSRYNGRLSGARKRDGDDAEADPVSRPHRDDGEEYEPRLRIQDRADLRNDSRRVIWRERDRDDSSREGSDSRTQRMYDGRDCRPRERRRKSRKLQDPGFADQMD